MIRLIFCPFSLENMYHLFSRTFVSCLLMCVFLKYVKYKDKDVEYKINKYKRKRERENKRMIYFYSLGIKVCTMGVVFIASDKPNIPMM